MLSLVLEGLQTAGPDKMFVFDQNSGPPLNWFRSV